MRTNDTVNSDANFFEELFRIQQIRNKRLGKDPRPKGVGRKAGPNWSNAKSVTSGRNRLVLS